MRALRIPQTTGTRSQEIVWKNFLPSPINSRRAGRQGAQGSGFRARLVSDPKTTYAAELGREIRAETKIVVLEERGDTLYLVLPCLPETLKTRGDIINEVARRELTYRNPCWGLGDGPDAGISCKA